MFLIVYELFYFDCKEDNGSEMKTNATVNLVYALTDVEIVAEDYKKIDVNCLYACLSYNKRLLKSKHN